MENPYLKPTEKVIQELRSSTKGLSKESATARYNKYGANKIDIKKKTTALQIFIKQFKSPLIFILVIAGIISLIFGEFIDSAFIWVAILINVIIGFIQEYKASNSLEKLLSYSVFTTTVIREGQLHQINSEKIVLGDILILKSGDKVPADARIIESKNLEVDESTLTGESHPINKNSDILKSRTVLAERKNMLYAGTNIVNGNCKVIVTSTGDSTEHGKIAKYIHSHQEEKTYIQKELDSLSKFIGTILISLIFIIFVIGLIRTRDIQEMFTESVALAVSALPEGLIVSIAIIFAIGMQKILKKKGLVRNLLATETLGRTEVLCIDKTGTLTKGKMSVTSLAFIDHDLEVGKTNNITNDVLSITLSASTLCNEAFHEIKKNKTKYRGNPTDIALLKLGNSFGLTKNELDSQSKIIDDLPFNPKTKYASTLVRKRNFNRCYVLGSPETIIRKSKKAAFYKKHKYRQNTKKIIKFLLEKNNNLSSKGYRILAVGYKDTKRDTINEKELQSITFLSFIVISDPLRESAQEAVKQTREAGLRLAIVTGDQATTAVNIASEVGIPHEKENILEGKDLEYMSDDDLDNIIERINLFVRITPSGKVRIIRSWKRKNKIVAMTGDGVNDAPALQLADIGIALGSGTDVAKESADIVLMNNNLKTIINAIEEGRGIIENIKKVILYLLSDSLAEVILVGFALVLGLPLPILALQILWVNIIEDGLPDVALSLEPNEKDLLKLKPKFFKQPIFDSELKLFTLVMGWVDDIALIGIFLYYFYHGHDIDFIRTMVFAALTIDSLFFAYACKSLRKPLWKTNLLNNKLLNLSFLLGIILLSFALYVPFFQNILQTVPIHFNHWLILIGIGFLDLIMLEITKEIFIFRRRKNQ